MADETADALRDMALHRGLKLVRSRRRKPGTGDFGKFGLIDANGTELLGFGDDGLTASAGEIEDYLRAGATSTWQQSAEITPDRKRPALDKTAKPRGEPGEAPSSVPKRVKANKSSKPPVPANDHDGETKPDKDAATPSPQASAPEPELKLRGIKSADADAVVLLLNQLTGVTTTKVELTRALGQVKKAGGEVLVAELGKVIGCIGWTIVPTLQRGLVGRITVLVIDVRHRRRGFGAKLLGAAEQAFRKKKCGSIEVMSDIDLKNSHGFFRAQGFEQKSYRFVRSASRD